VTADFSIHVEKRTKNTHLKNLVSIHTSRDKEGQNTFKQGLKKNIESADSWTGMFERSVKK